MTFIEKVANKLSEEYEINENITGITNFLKKCFDEESHLKINVVEEYKIQRFEEIKQMAAKIYCDHCFSTINGSPISEGACWEQARKFYEYAKQKEEEVGDENDE